jgi:hypothetical protein
MKLIKLFAALIGTALPAAPAAAFIPSHPPTALTDDVNLWILQCEGLEAELPSEASYLAGAAAAYEAELPLLFFYGDEFEANEETFEWEVDQILTIVLWAQLHQYGTTGPVFDYYEGAIDACYFTMATMDAEAGLVCPGSTRWAGSTSGPGLAPEADPPARSAPRDKGGRP